MVKRASEPESFSISAEDCQSTIVGSAAGPRLARLRRKSAPKGGGVTRRRNRDAGQEAQARIYISIAPCAEKLLPIGVENDVAFLRTLRMASSALLPRPCEDSSSSATCSCRCHAPILVHSPSLLSTPRLAVTTTYTCSDARQGTSIPGLPWHGLCNVWDTHIRQPQMEAPRVLAKLPPTNRSRILLSGYL